MCFSLSSRVIKALLFSIIVISLGSCVAIKDIRYSKGGTSINLSKKGLTSFPNEVFDNKELKVLRLYGNKIDSIPERIGELVNLEKIYLGKNNLTSLPKSIGNLKNLRILSAQFNDITSLPEEIGDLTSLKHLSLNQNRLITLPSGIGKLQQLEVLELRFNFLTSIPDEITDCANLKFIYLNRNNLSMLPAEINKLQSLKELHLATSGVLINVPESLCQIRNLEVLEIDFQVAIPPCLLVLKANRLQILLR